MLTIQHVTADSPECAKLLRKVIRDNETANYGEGWRIRANQATDWKLLFTRRIKGDTGEPDEEIEVQTDFALGMPYGSRFGMIQAFGDCKPVLVVRPSSFQVDGANASIVAKLLADGSRLSLQCCAGSTASSQEGLSFYFAEATFPKMAYGRVQIGYTTTAKDGRELIAGSVSIR